MLVLISPDAHGVYMLGSRDPLSWTAPAVLSILGSASAAADFAGAPDVAVVAGRPWMSILESMVWLRDGQVARFAGNASLITDDHPLTEYCFLHVHFADPSPAVTADLLRRLAPG